MACQCLLSQHPHPEKESGHVTCSVICCHVTNCFQAWWLKTTTTAFAHNSAGQDFGQSSAGMFCFMWCQRGFLRRLQSCWLTNVGTRQLHQAPRSERSQSRAKALLLLFLKFITIFEQGTLCFHLTVGFTNCVAGLGCNQMPGAGAFRIASFTNLGSWQGWLEGWNLSNTLHMASLGFLSGSWTPRVSIPKGKGKTSDHKAQPQKS